jgi:hypothetical protein
LEIEGVTNWSNIDKGAALPRENPSFLAETDVVDSGSCLYKILICVTVGREREREVEIILVMNSTTFKISLTHQFVTLYDITEGMAYC